MKALISLFVAVTTAALAQTPVALSFSANAALTSSTTYAFNGSGTLTGLGTAILSGGGSIDPATLSGTVAGILPGSFTLIFPDNAVLFGTYNIPTGVVIPQAGGSTSAAGSLTITGGSGRFEGARGVFAPITGSGTATGLTTGNFTVSGSGPLSVGQYVLPQFVFGDGWYTALYFANSKSTVATFPVNFISDTGTPLTVPSLGGTSTTVSIPAGGSARIEAPNVGARVQGYVSVTLPEGVTGYGVFRQSVTGSPDQEAVVPLANAGGTTSSFAFDDTNYITTAGIVNPSSLANTVTITATSQTGSSLGTATIPLPARSKTAVALRNVTGLAIANNRGTLTFTVSSGNVAVLGLRFFGSAFTSIPATDH